MDKDPIKMTKTINIFDTPRNSKDSLISTNLGSIKSTLFGKFYEGIVAHYLVDREGYKHLQGKPCVYWKDIPANKHSKNNLLNTLYQGLTDVNNSKKVHTNSDGLYFKEGKYYLWEAKNWPKWKTDKSIYEQTYKLLLNSPWILAKSVIHKNKTYNINGILFSWWQEFDNYEELENELSDSIGLKFKFYFTNKILDECRSEQYDWYIKLIKEQEKNINELFNDLLSPPS